MYHPKKIQLVKFTEAAFLPLGKSNQIDYLRCYLEDLGAETILIEPFYFDRDYLSEFAAFYGTSSRGYDNVCQRWHFFGMNVTRSTLRNLVGGNPSARSRVQKNYFGFSVVRPISAAPLGRTVLAWYPDQRKETPRNSSPSRDYSVHIAGIELSVRGLAWQQQDTGVGACATIGLWTMFHSSAFDDHHAIPTTAEITRSAHRTASLGARVFPSKGLSLYQLSESIKEQHLAPVVLGGDSDSCVPDIELKGFSKSVFSSSCAAFLRSGYPVLLSGYLKGAGLHANCAVGFREPRADRIATKPAELADSFVEHIYIHDDNLGPSVRFSVGEEPGSNVVKLSTDPPPARNGVRNSEPTKNYPAFYPTQIIAAVHDDLRLSPQVLHSQGLKITIGIELVVNDSRRKQGSQPIPGFWLSSRFLKLADFAGKELATTLDGNSKLLSRTRLQLAEQCPPLSLHIGVVRISLTGAIPVADFLFDTTDGDLDPPIFAHISYATGFEQVVAALANQLGASFGKSILAY